MAGQGWILLHRSLFGKGYYRKSAYVHLWVHLLLKANHSESEILWNGRTERLRPGEFITGRHQLSMDTGIPESTIERILKCFENGHQIEQQKNNKFRRITVINWNEYQRVGQQNEQQTDSKRTASGQPADTDKECKELKNRKKLKSSPPGFDVFWNAFPKKVGKGAAENAWDRIRPNDNQKEKMLRALDWQRQQDQWVKDGGRFIPNPATWLNQGRWEDEPPSVRSSLRIGAHLEKEASSGLPSERDDLIKEYERARTAFESLNRLLTDSVQREKFPEKINEWQAKRYKAQIELENLVRKLEAQESAVEKEVVQVAEVAG